MRQMHTQARLHSSPPASNRRMVYFTGRVQGVGFRYTAQNVALRYDVAGYVRNLPDGRVELVMEGPDSEMDQVLEEVRRKMGFCIRKIDCDQAPASGEFEQFSVRH